MASFAVAQQEVVTLLYPRQYDHHSAAGIPRNTRQEIGQHHASKDGQSEWRKEYSQYLASTVKLSSVPHFRPSPLFPSSPNHDFTVCSMEELVELSDCL